MKLSSLIKIIEAKYPLDLAYDWDNVGLLVGDFDLEIKKILLALEANENVINEAINKNVDLIITHHPFIFRKMNKINTKDLKGKLIHKLIKNDIALYSMHTNFDIAFDGLNDYFMEIMGFENTKILDITNSEILYKLVIYTPITHELLIRKTLGEIGAGHIGNYSHCTFNIQGLGTFKPQEKANPFIGAIGEIEEVTECRIETIVPQSILQKTLSNIIKVHPYEEVAYDIYKLENKGNHVGLGRYAELNQNIDLQGLCEKIKLKLNMSNIRVVGELNRKINKVAVVTGAGSDMLNLAKNKNCDVLITGDVKYHEAQDALDLGICIIDCGHFDTENIFKDVMKRFLYEFQEIEILKSEINLNPFKII